MASSEDKRSIIPEQENTENSQRTQRPLENPFIAFRRLADETIGSALQSIIGLPSAVSKQLEGALPGLDKIRNDNAKRLEEAESLITRDKFQREHQHEKPPNTGSESPHELIEELKRRREQHRQKWEHIKEAIHQGPDAVPREMSRRTLDEYDIAERDRSSSGFPMPGHPSDDFADSFFKHVGMFGPTTLGPLGAILSSKLNTIMPSDGFGPYLILSPYSPLFLSDRMYDNTDRYTQDPFPYCDAFEDLLLASRGKDMVSLEERRRRESALPQYPGRPHDIGLAASWLSRLQRKGLLESPLPRDEDLEGTNPATELSMYSSFLSKAGAQIPERQHEASKVDTVTKKLEFDHEEEASSKGGILSTLTRTESTRFPDGRIETKVVLIKRFADGAETRTETVHTNHESTESDGGRLDGSKKTVTEERKGWFWN